MTTPWSKCYTGFGLARNESVEGIIASLWIIQIITFFFAVVFAAWNAIQGRRIKKIRTNLRSRARSGSKKPKMRGGALFVNSKEKQAAREVQLENYLARQVIRGTVMVYESYGLMIGFLLTTIASLIISVSLRTAFCDDSAWRTLLGNSVGA